MLGKVLLFELRYQIRRRSFFISLAVATSVIFLFVTGLLMRAGENQAMLKLNGPIMAARMLAGLCVGTLLIPLLIFGRAALRDAETGMEGLVRVTPTSLPGLLLARVAAAFLVVTLIYATAVPSAELALRMPWVDPSLVGAFRPDAYMQTYAFLVLPNIFIFGCVAFAAAAWTRSIASAYGLFILFISLPVVVHTTALKFSLYHGPLLDPFGIVALNSITRYWVAAQLNADAIPMTGVLLWNRLLWGSAGAVLLAVTVLFLPRRVKGRRPAVEESSVRDAMIPQVAMPKLRPGVATTMDQFFTRLYFESVVAVRSWTFLFMLVLLAGLIVAVLQLPDQSAGPSFLPMTIVIAPNVSAVAEMTGLLMITLFAGDIMWRERASHIWEIVDATPVPNSILFAGKLGALTLLTILYFLVATAVGSAVQVWRGSTDIAWGIFATHAALGGGIVLVMLAVVAMLAHTLVPNKYVGHLAVLGFVAILTIAYVLGFEDGLYQFGSIPRLPISVMNGFGHYLEAALWFTGYWGAVTLLIAVAVQFLWARGLRTSLVDQIRSAPQRATRTAVTVLAGGILIAGTAGGVIYWNTHIRNSFATQWDVERFQADYERSFSADLRKPQPRITDINMAVDLHPDERLLRSRGTYRLVNSSGTLITTVRVQFNDTMKVQKVELENAELVSHEPRFNDYVFQPATALGPGESLRLSFAATLSYAGFRHAETSVPINANGTFIGATEFAPWIGVLPRLFITDEVRRRKLSLPVLSLAEHNGMVDGRRNFLTPDSDFVHLGVTLSTSADQTAVGPGKLKREWEEWGRRFFFYESEQPIINFWSIFSGRYATARATWAGVDLAVLHHPTQGQNVPRMLTGMQQALSYFSRTFGPFQHSELRMAEYPYGSIAQSFPASISFSEMLGFMADGKTDAIDYIGFVTAHEVAHQWWGHQAVPARMPGAQLLSETLAEYSALMVMETLYGPDGIRPYLKADLDAYLSQRGKGDAERPLSAVRMHQGHIAYKKGAVAMYAIKDAIGQEAMDRTLRRYLEKYRNAFAPYPVASDFLTLLREEAGPDNQALITDLFETITLWDFGVVHASTKPLQNSKWQVTVVVKGKKATADETGAETSSSLNDNVDIGLFDADPSSKKFAPHDVIVLEKRRFTDGVMRFEFLTERRPTFAGVNPYLKLIERNTQDNVTAVVEGVEEKEFTRDQDDF